jgi:hypothetical protein
MRTCIILPHLLDKFSAGFGLQASLSSEILIRFSLVIIFVLDLSAQQISAADVPWTKQEEDVLKEAVDRFQGGSQQPIRTWHLHSSILNASIAARGRLRMGKHCMEYWNARLCSPTDPAMQQQQQQQQQKVCTEKRLILSHFAHSPSYLDQDQSTNRNTPKRHAPDLHCSRKVVL